MVCPMCIRLQRFEMEDFCVNNDKNRLLNRLQIPNIFLQNIFIYLSIVCRNIDIKYYKYKYRHLKITIIMFNIYKLFYIGS